MTIAMTMMVLLLVTMIRMTMPTLFSPLLPARQDSSISPVTRVHVEVTDPNRLSTRAAGGWAYWSIKELRCLLLHPPLTQLTSLLTNEKCWHLVKPLKNIVMTWSWPLQAIWPPAPIVQSWKPNENMSGQPPPLSFYGCSTKNSVVFISLFCEKDHRRISYMDLGNP